jgi:diacylglycerol kinase (ATP)
MIPPMELEARTPAVARSRPVRRRGSPRLTLIANARASGLSSPRLVERLAHALADAGAEVEVALTRSEDEMAARWPAGGRRVVLAGGDGTLHAAANVAPPGAEMALIPAGRANNAARSLGIPLEPDAAARLAATGAARPLDLIRASHPDGAALMAVEGVSVGFLALARARYHAANSADVLAAAGAALAAAIHFHPLEVTVETDGAVARLHIGQLFVANLPRYGTGLRVAPDADPRDGLLDLVAIDAAGRRSIPGLLLHVRRGRHLGRPEVTTWRARRIAIRTRGCSPVVADSEDLGSAPVVLEVVPGALHLVAPAP